MTGVYRWVSLVVTPKISNHNLCESEVIHADDKQTGIIGCFHTSENQPSHRQKGKSEEVSQKEGVVKLEEAQLLTDSQDVQNKPMKERN